MATTTVRLDPDEERALDALAEVHGGRSNAIRMGLRLLVAETTRQEALTSFLSDWELDAGPVSDDEVLKMAERYQLDS